MNELLLKRHFLYLNTVCWHNVNNLLKVLVDVQLKKLISFNDFEGDPSYCEKCGFVWMIIRMWLHINKLRLFEKEVLEWENESLICTLLKPARHTQTIVRAFVNSWTISYFVREKLVFWWQGEFSGRENGDGRHFWYGTDSWSIQSMEQKIKSRTLIVK